MARPYLTVASIGVTPSPINVFILSDSEPEFRDNGGDLQQGDRWYNQSLRVESIFIDERWTLTSTTPSK